jgi:hypothetical protein
MATKEQLEAQIAALEQARLDRLTGKQVQRTAYDGHLTEFSEPPSLEEINQALTQLRLELAKLTGDWSSTGVGPMRIGYGCRL